MQKKTFSFDSSSTTCYFDAALTQIGQIADREQAVFVTDQHVFDLHKKYFRNARVVVIPPGESAKNQQTVDHLIGRLIDLGADRKTIVIGVGGGVVTDISGYAASVYMRGISFGFVPTSVLGMVDASIGGKNGIDVGDFKNLVGTIRQPAFLFYDTSLLKTLPSAEWVNGFAEIIKHAAIKDAALFRELEKNSLPYYRKNKKALAALIRRNVMIKSAVVLKDEWEEGDRKLLNFGHTLGHAVENSYHIPHGHAVSIGIQAACIISEELLNFKETARVTDLLEKYGLPTRLQIDFEKVMGLMRMDKKKIRDTMNYVLLQKIGHAVVKPIPMKQLEKLFYSISRAR